MKKKKLLKTGLAVALAVMTLAQPVSAANWVGNNTGWWWQEDNGSYPTNQWKAINGKWYWFDGNGYMVTGWRNINGTWYYLESSGAMASNKWIGNYYVESSGAMATNKWIDDYFYVDSTGRLVEIAGDGHHWNDGIITTEPTSILEGVKTYTCIYCGATKTEPVRPLDHNWVNFEWPDFKNGYACNICYNDVTDYDDYYDCHGGWHTHTFYNFPSYYSCDSCDKLIHKHKSVSYTHLTLPTIA